MLKHLSRTAVGLLAAAATLAAGSAVSFSAPASPASSAASAYAGQSTAAANRFDYRNPAVTSATTVVRGRLGAIEVQQTATSTPETSYAIETLAGDVRPIRLTRGVPARFESGTVVARLAGDGEVAEMSVAAPPSSVRRAAPAPRAHHAYVFKLTNRGTYDNRSDAQVNALVDQVLGRWQQQSDGRITSFTRTGGITRFAADAACSESSALWNQAADLFPDVSFGSGSGNHVIVVTPGGGDCSFAVGTVGPSAADGGGLSNGGRLALTDSAQFYQALMHELGHNLSLAHARSRDCTAPGPSSCTLVEYGNDYSFMSSSGSAPAVPTLGSMERSRLQILQTCEVQQAALGAGQGSATSVYDLSARGTRSGTRGILITDPTTGDRYNLDWRQRIGLDTGAPYDDEDQGVIVEQVEEGFTTVLQTLSVDGDEPDYSLDPGEQTTLGGVTVQVRSGSSTNREVGVTLAGTGTAAPSTQRGRVGIAGKARPGSTVSARPAGFTPQTCYRYQWYAEGQPIPDARAATYTVPRSLLGKRLAVRIVGQRPGFRAAIATSAAHRVAVPFRATRKPTITGRATVGRTLRARTGAWAPKPTTWRYRWFAGGQKVARATGRTLEVTPKMRGKRITVRVVGSRTGVETQRRTSAPTSRVARR